MPHCSGGGEKEKIMADIEKIITKRILENMGGEVEITEFERRRADQELERLTREIEQMQKLPKQK